MPGRKRTRRKRCCRSRRNSGGSRAAGKRLIDEDKKEGCAVPKKIPMRQCVGCREMKPKRELIRVVRGPEGEVSLDFRGKKPGRGAYVCPDPACLRKARKSNALGRAFAVAIPSGVYEALEAQMARGDGDG